MTVPILRLRLSPRELMCWVLAVSLAPSVASFGDVIQLKNAGEIRGEIDRDSVRSKGPLRITTLGGTEIEVPLDQLEQYAFRPVRIEEFETRLRDTPHAIESYRELAAWCTQQRMTPQRNECLEKIIELNPNDSDARRLLDHVQFKGEWMPREEMMRQRGFVKHRHRYITEQELALLEKTQAEREVEREWLGRVRQWSNWLYGTNPARSQEALIALRGLTDPAAIQGLVTVFQNHSDKNARLLLVEVLAKIGSPDAVPPLALQAVFDSDSEVRYQAVTSIPEKYHPAAAERFAYNLRNADNAIVRRAAQALQYVGGDAVIDDLINALITRHIITVHVPANDSFTLNTTTGQMGAPQSILPADIELMSRAGQLPYGYQATTPTTVKTRPVKYQIDASNEEVLVALQKLTGQNFGYNERSWRIWLAASKNQSPALSNAAPPG